MYTMLGISTFSSVVHGMFVYGFEESNESLSLLYFQGLGVVNFVGQQSMLQNTSRVVSEETRYLEQ